MKKLPDYKLRAIKKEIVDNTYDWIDVNNTNPEFDITIGKKTYNVYVCFDYVTKKVYEGSARDHRDLPYIIQEYKTKFIAEQVVVYELVEYEKGEEPEEEFVCEFTNEQLFDINCDLEKIWN